MSVLLEGCGWRDDEGEHPGAARSPREKAIVILILVRYDEMKALK